MHAAQRWLLVGAINEAFEVPVADVRSMERTQRGATEKIDPTSVQPVGQALPRSGKMCNEVPLSQARHMLCGDCGMLDGSCVNTNGDCVTSSPCGANTTTPGDGNGSAYLQLGNVGCDITFTDDSLMCAFSGTPQPPSGNLFQFFQKNAAFWVLVCGDPPSWGWAASSYWDGRGAGQHFRFIDPSTGTNEWNYPSDYPPINGIYYPPQYPVTVNNQYFAFGVSWHGITAYQQGYCDHTEYL